MDPQILAQPGIPAEATPAGSPSTWLARGASLEEAVAYAVRAGAAAVTREGAQGALPTPEVVEAL